jgi:hypothetical protein
MEISHSHDGLGEHINKWQKVNSTRIHKPSSLPLQKHLCFNITSTLMYVPNVTTSLLFLPSNKGFSASLAQKGFFPHRGFIFP